MERYPELAVRRSTRRVRGLTRGEQEQALQEIHDDAQRHEEYHREK